MAIGATAPARRVLPLDVLLWTAALVGIGLRVLLATTRRYQVDEVEHVNTAFQLAQGAVIYRDFLEVHPPSLYFVLAPLIIPDDPGLSFGLARTVMLIPAFATFGLVYWLGRRLHSARAGAWGLALLALHTTFAERGIEVRPDMWLGALSLAALCMELSDWRTRRWRTVVAAFLLGIACTFSLKVVFIVAALGSVWIVRAVRARDPRTLLAAAGAFALPQLVGPLVFTAMGAGREYWTYVFWRPAEAVLTQDDAALADAFRPWAFLASEGVRNLAFVGAVALGLARAMPLPGKARDDRLAIAFVFAGGTLLYLVANPYPYPYLHVAVLPTLAILAGAGLAHGLPRLTTPVSALAATVILGGAGLQYVPRVLAKAADTHEAQVTLMEALNEITEPDDAVFDAVGLYFRPHGAYAWVMPRNIAAEYRRGDYPSLIDDMRARQTVATMYNYRTVQYLPPAEQAFLESHFVHYAANIFVMGTDLGGAPVGEQRVFEVLKPRSFRFTGPPGALEVDGLPFRSGVLARGEHTLRVLGPTEGGALIMDPPGERIPQAAPAIIYVNFD